ncbi:hypothetical protein [Bartonella massiliensis]|uniref:hypothetical protein n=1 Tax=Bartonella massiliensis TaxID=929795 RepID=UPI00115779F4|nr:hypothetical protein [Bartonella massiliensis]
MGSDLEILFAVFCKNVKMWNRERVRGSFRTWWIYALFMCRVVRRVGVVDALGACLGRMGED